MAIGDKFVVEGAKIRCAIGLQPFVKLKITAQRKLKVDGKKAALESDNKPANIPSFKQCLVPGAPPTPCKYMPGMWMNTFTKKKVGGKSVLIGKSCLMCSKVPGLGIITVLDTGQRSEKIWHNSAKCTIEGCTQGNTVDHIPQNGQMGDHVGNSVELARRLMLEYYVDKTTHPNAKQSDSVCDPVNHPLSTPVNGTGKPKPNKPGKFYAKGGGTAQAHHLICSEAVGEDDWPEYCAIFGYDINCIENGVFFPNDMELACDLGIPLHRSNHNKAPADGTTYVEAVKNKIREVGSQAEKKTFCKENDGTFIKEMNKVSKFIYNKVINFDWMLTEFGKDYKKGMGTKGCRNAETIPEKKDKGNLECAIRKAGSGFHHPLKITELISKRLYPYTYKEAK